MLKIIAYYFLLFYAAAVCKPVTIWLADVVAHGSFPHQHMAGVHHQQGKAHVHYQIDKAAKEDAPQQKNTSPKTEDDVVTTPPGNEVSGPDSNFIVRLYTKKFFKLSTVFLSLDSPPPNPAA